MVQVTELYVIKTIDMRENNEGFCCYMARHNGEDFHGEQIYRSAKNTAKTRLLRESLFNLLGNDKTISFCYLYAVWRYTQRCFPF